MTSELKTLNPVEGLVRGLHHITLVTSNQEVNRRFYAEVLGLRRVKLTVNQDDIYHRHIFFADEKGSTGSAITFFEWPDMPRGKVGLGSPHHLAYNVSSIDSLPKWKSWLKSQGVSVSGPFARNDLVSLYLRDPDGTLIEIAAENSDKVSSEDLLELEPSVNRITQGMKLSTFNHASPVSSDVSLTSLFLDKLVGLKSNSNRPNPDEDATRILSIGNEERPDFLNYISTPKAREGLVGSGNIHHIAMAVDEDEDQLRIMRRLNDAKIGNSGIVDRFWFKSLYFRDPDGNLLEIATKKPGYTADEPLETLGSKLVLPAWLEPSRTRIEKRLSDQDSVNSGKWPKEFPEITGQPERLLG